MTFDDLPSLFGIAAPAVQPQREAILETLVAQYASVSMCSICEAKERMRAALSPAPEAIEAGRRLIEGIARGIQSAYFPRTRPPRRLARRAHAKRLARRSA